MERGGVWWLMVCDPVSQFTIPLKWNVVVYGGWWYVIRYHNLPYRWNGAWWCMVVDGMWSGITIYHTVEMERGGVWWLMVCDPVSQFTIPLKWSVVVYGGWWYVIRYHNLPYRWNGAWWCMVVDGMWSGITIYHTVELECSGCCAVVDGVGDPISRESWEGELDIVVVCDCDPGGGRVVTVLLLRYPDCIQQFETGYGTDQGQVVTLVSFDGSSIPAWRSVPWK